MAPTTQASEAYPPTKPPQLAQFNTVSLVDIPLNPINQHSRHLPSCPHSQEGAPPPTEGEQGAMRLRGGCIDFSSCPALLDKGIKSLAGKLGFGAKVSNSNVEKASDGVRSLFKKFTGKDVPIKDQEMK
ncbi:hypothetical protein MNV49_002490 [Pseudohyphozyma bogoriensis]|nr:hypothetical protein MNV49_002490 [Pseudohyphozyma bogoriensis]